MWAKGTDISMLVLANQISAAAAERPGEDIVCVDPAGASVQPQSIGAAKTARALDIVSAFAIRIAHARDLAEIGRALGEVVGGFCDIAHAEIFAVQGSGPSMLSAAVVASTIVDPVSIRQATIDLASEVAVDRQTCRRSWFDRNALPVYGLGTPLPGSSPVVGAVVLWSYEGFDELDERLLGALCAMAAAILAHAREAMTSRLLLEAVERSEEAVSIYDAAGTILFSNQAYHRVFPAYPEAKQLAGMTHEDLYRLDLAKSIIKDPVALADPERYLAERLRLFQELEGEIREVQAIGDKHYLYTRARIATGESFSRRIDITEMKAAEDQLRASQRRIEEIAFTDPTTGLPNRVRFRDVVEDLIHQGRSSFAVLLINLDRFRTINDGLGDAAGDALLAAVGTRLKHCVAEGGAVARLDSDEFALLHSGSGEGAGLLAKVAAVLACFDEDFVIGERHLSVRASIGVARYPDAGSGTDALLQNAGLALGRAKAASRGSFCFFEAGMEASLADRRAIALDLREAIALGQLDVYYQPLVGALSGFAEGFEALARWRHPTRGSVSPVDFIPIAEESGLIAEIGAFVLKRSIADARRWPANVSVAVNLSARQLAKFDLVDIVQDAAGTDFDLRRLELEITETALLENDAHVLDRLNRLRALGVGISLDDFGTGFSSLSYLLSFPFTKIKIDRSFISDVVDRRDALAIVKSVVDLAANLGMRTTAEGVETADQAQCLRDLGCGQLQGYLIAKPASSAEAGAWLALNQA